MTDARPTLTARQTSALNSAYAALKAGRAAEAVETLRPVLGGGLVHADAYWLFATACRATGDLAGARTALNAAINLDPANATFWSALGDLLEQMGHMATALVARSRAYERAPDDAGMAFSLADLALRLGDGAAAEGPMRHMLLRDAGSPRARHALAIALRLQSRSADALAVIAPLGERADAPAESAALHAHLLAETGDFDGAVGAYRKVTARHPLFIDAQESLARLLPQLGRADEALDQYAAALDSQPADPGFWSNALATARKLRQFDRLTEWADRAARAFPGDKAIQALAADARGHAGDPAAALDALKPLAIGDANAALLAAHWALALGDGAAASDHAGEALRLSPDSVTAWAYQGTAWRLLGDDRAAWLNDYDRLTTSLMLEAPPGYSSLAEFLEVLATALDGMHLARDHPADQSLRGGTQTSGHLFLRDNAHVAALGLQLHRQIEGWLAGLPTDASHPFLRRNSRRILFRHSWSVRLRGQGFHISHIHQDGWLSSAFYVRLPATVGSTGEGGLPQGALTLGAPDASLGLDLGPERVMVPRPGMLALFPSHVWHGTTPFDGTEPRLTVAFDAVPA